VMRAPSVSLAVVNLADDDDDDEATVVSHTPQDVLASLEKATTEKAVEKPAAVEAAKKQPVAAGRAPTLAERVAAVAHRATSAVAERTDRAAAVPAPQVVEDEATEWRGVFEEFVRIKKECGEPTEGLSFEKFQTTLRKNRDQLVTKHGCKRVKFSVYVKEGRAALKASPVKD
jgi:hypothetical protein